VANYYTDDNLRYYFFAFIVKSGLVSIPMNQWTMTHGISLFRPMKDICMHSWFWGHFACLMLCWTLAALDRGKDAGMDDHDESSREWLEHILLFVTCGQVDRENILWGAHCKEGKHSLAAESGHGFWNVSDACFKITKEPINRAMGSQHIETSMGHNHPLFVLHFGKRLPFTI